MRNYTFTTTADSTPGEVWTVTVDQASSSHTFTLREGFYNNVSVLADGVQIQRGAGTPDTITADWGASVILQASPIVIPAQEPDALAYAFWFSMAFMAYIFYNITRPRAI